MLATDGSAGAATVAGLKAQAASIESQINAAGVEISALGQKYDEAENQISTLTQQIATTQNTIVADKQHVHQDQATLRKAALNNYMSDGSAADANPLFAGNQLTFGEQREYSQVAEGDLGTAVADLHTAQVQLGVQEATLNNQKQQQEAAAAAAANAKSAADRQQASEQSALNQVTGQLQLLVNQEQEAQNLAKRDDHATAPGRLRLLADPAAAVGRWRGRRGRGRGREPARRPLCLGWRVPGPRVRLLGADGVGLGTGRRVAPPLFGRPDGRHDSGAGLGPRTR